MKQVPIAFLLALGCSLAQTAADTPEAHRVAAKTAAGTDLTGIFNAACPSVGAGPGAVQGRGGRGGPRTTPPQEEWYTGPVQVFDNLYFLGTKVHAAWAVKTSGGFIVIDSLFGYAAEPEITGGMKKLGLDPTQIKYVIISHGHADHSGGARRTTTACR